MKTKTVSIRLSDDEFTLLSQQASKDRCTISQLIREHALHPNDTVGNGMARRIVPELCSLSAVITNLPPSNTKDKLIESEAKLWQSIE